MASDDKKQPIVIKKVYAAHGHHGGAWKVAYADFVTAMMAFFLLMWILGSTSPKQREGMSQFFKNPSAIQGPGGASTSMIKLGGTRNRVTGPTQEASIGGAPQKPTRQQLLKEAEQLDHKRLLQLEKEIKHAIDTNPLLKPYKNQLYVDITPQGLRIQLVDMRKRSMFAKGSAGLMPYAKKIFERLGRFLNQVPNKISIVGNTDAYKYLNHNMSNWQLSTERANAAHTALLMGGMHSGKVASIVGLGATGLFNKKNPYSPLNRRISLIVLNKKTEMAMSRANQYGKSGKKAISLPAVSAGSTATIPVSRVSREKVSTH